MLNNKIKRFLILIKLTANFRKPMAFLSLTHAYLKARMLKTPVLRGVDIVTNYTCNLRCTHCNIDSMARPGRSNEFTLDDYLRVEKECTELGVFQYTFTGGEPLLRIDFEKIVKIFKPYKRIMLIQTNGALITSLEKANWLKKIGIDIVNVSLDSGIPREHDENRGLPGHYDQTIRAVEFCKQAGLQVIIGTVVTHKNIYSEGMKSLFDFSRKNKISVILNLAVPIGRWFNNKNIILTDEDQKHVRALVKKNPFMFLDMDSTINEYGCPAFKEKLYISPYGDVTGCTFVPISFGNLKEKSLKEIRELALKTDLMSTYAKKCYAAENHKFIQKYMSQLGGNVPKYYKDVMKTEKGFEHALENYRCKICGSTENTLALKDGIDYEYGIEGSFNFYECEHCKLISLQPVPSLSEIQSFYPLGYHSYQRPNSFLFKKLSSINLNQRAKRYKKLIGNAGKILDVGCGDGEIMEAMEQRGNFDCFGVEIKEEIAKKGQAKGLKIYCGTLETSDELLENHFDLIIINHLIEHVQDPLLTLQKAYRLLRKGGWATGETPNTNSIGMRKLESKWSGYHIPRHLNLFSDKNMETLFHKTGFAKVEIKKSLNPGHWALSFQNIFLHKYPNMRRKNGKAWIYPFCLLAAIPVTLFENSFSTQSDIVYFEVQK